jgi:hypothetical protein
MAQGKAVAFISYVRADDSDGRITELCQRLGEAVRQHTGEDFPIFQDRNDIRWGENWKDRVEEVLDEVTFLIPIVTPNFFQSLVCRLELERFLYREKELWRKGLILPVYYVDTPLLNDPARRATDELAQAIADRQYSDWRELRLLDLGSPQVQHEITRLVVQISSALKRAPIQFLVGTVAEALRTGGVSLIKRSRRKDRAVR